MPLICYVEQKFSTGSTAIIDKANEILSDYEAQGFDLTLRQLYYQFVARAIIANKDSEYKRLGSIINDARLAGLIDWNHITDRTRNMRQNGHWENPQSIIRSCANAFELDKWAVQDNYVEVWVEKDALVGVLQQACKPLDVPYFSCRGYTSQSEMWAAAMRLRSKLEAGKKCHIIHLGDHDPSGIDMSRDIEDRLTMFMRLHVLQAHVRAVGAVKEGGTKEAWRDRVGAVVMEDESYLEPVTIHRIALNMDQIEEYDPPPNPAKLTDARAAGYIEKFGYKSWELDALEPSVITQLITDTVVELRDQEAWEQISIEEDKHKEQLSACAKKWEKVCKVVS